LIADGESLIDRREEHPLDHPSEVADLHTPYERALELITGRSTRSA
jgi:hypothetical protein